MIDVIAQDSSGRRLALRLSGKLTRDEYAEMAKDLERRLAEHEKLCLLVDTSDWESLEPGVVWDDFKFGLAHWNGFERFALLGDASWGDMVAQIGGAITEGEVRHFALAEREEAYAWVGLEPPVPSPRDTQ